MMIMLSSILLVASTIAVVVLALRLAVTLKRYAAPEVPPLPHDLPSVSVCIAARNETHALAQCLERVLRSDYPKLEILVFDDSSSDDTSLIIKSFAGAGVRFIAGKVLPDGWLGKNHAYQTLIDEASGDCVVFLDVDTTIRTTTISQLVAIMYESESAMLSVLPRREDSHRTSAILGTMRYVWELLLGTRVSPPAASALWMAEKAALQADGEGLRHYGSSVRPERHLARRLHRIGKYRYIIGTQSLGVGFEKHLNSQQHTAVRLYYPMSGRSVVGLLAASSFLFFLSVPLLHLIAVLFTAIEDLHLTWSVLLIIFIHVLMTIIAVRTYGRVGRPVRTLVWPLVIVHEFVLLIGSFIAYGAGNVSWKGRSVHVGPHRPDALSIDD